MTPWIDLLAAGARRELLEDILPFWRRRTVDARGGGFIGRMSNDLRVDEGAAKGLILNARILWTFSAVHRFTGHAEDRALAERAYGYLTERLIDREHGGCFWSLDPGGRPVDTRKKIYGQAFAVYALAEHAVAFGAAGALDRAVEIFRRIEAHARDPVHGGYLETRGRDWTPCADVRLGEKDLDEPKSMNNHLHLLEAYTGLLRAWPDPVLEERLRELIEIFRTRILMPDGVHLGHFYDEGWRPRSEGSTFGHDVEASWLLVEAAGALGDGALLAGVRDLAVPMARAVLAEGLDGDGGLLYERRGGRIVDGSKEWWPQAEAVVGFLSAWEISGDVAFLEAAGRCWRFIEERIVDREHGEWFWRVSREGVPDLSMPKVSEWKGPYHNGRACLEVIRRIGAGDPAGCGGASHPG